MGESDRLGHLHAAADAGGQGGALLLTRGGEQESRERDAGVGPDQVRGRRHRVGRLLLPAPRRSALHAAWQLHRGLRLEHMSTRRTTPSARLPEERRT